MKISELIQELGEVQLAWGDINVVNAMDEELTLEVQDDIVVNSEDNENLVAILVVE